MLTVTFKAKPERVLNMDGTLAYRRVKVPKLKPRHCDMSAFRTSRRFGPYANSDMFESVLARELARLGIPAYIKLEELPDAVEADESGYLAKITIHIPE